MKRKEMKYFTKIEAINATTHFSFASSENVSLRFVSVAHRSKAVQLIIWKYFDGEEKNIK